MLHQYSEFIFRFIGHLESNFIFVKDKISAVCVCGGVGGWGSDCTIFSLLIIVSILFPILCLPYAEAQFKRQF